MASGPAREAVTDEVTLSKSTMALPGISSLGRGRGRGRGRATQLICLLALHPLRANIVSERGLRLDSTGAFYRAASALSRDCAVLAAAVHSERELAGRPLRVLDAFGGCGSRSARYLERGVASFVQCNEGSPELGATIRANLEPYGAENASWAISHADAHALLLRNEGAFAFDLIDLDSFGLSARAISAAMWSVKLGGLLYVTQTDGRAHTAPERCLAAYGAWPAPSSATHAAANEQATRLLVGHAVREAALHGLEARPLFSLFSAHGPCFRAMLSVRRAPARTPALAAVSGFVSTCGKCGQHAKLGWDALGRAACPNCGASGEDVRVAGPMHVGALHDAAFLAQMAAVAERWGDDYAEARALLAALALEAEVEGAEGEAPLFYHAHSVASRAGLAGPCSLALLIEALRADGWRAGRTHFAPKFGLKTSAPVEAQIRVARAIAGRAPTVRATEVSVRKNEV